MCVCVCVCVCVCLTDCVCVCVFECGYFSEFVCLYVSVHPGMWDGVLEDCYNLTLLISGNFDCILENLISGSEWNLYSCQCP